MSDQSLLIAHVHVPKTAGSAINAALGAMLGAGRDHVQALIGDQTAFAALASESRWIAGHIPAPDLRSMLNRAGVKARFVTALREPMAQVASHYNWLIEIGHRGEAFLNGHPPAIRDLHRRIQSSDNSRARTVMRNLEANAGLFMNCQARHVVGKGFDAPETSYSAALEEFDAVVFSNDVAEGLAPVCPTRAVVVEQRNVSRYHFDRDVFSDPELRAFLLDRNRADEALWAVANAKFRAGNNGEGDTL